MVFNDFYWHDAIIKEISINRTEPGINDDLRFLIKFPDFQNDVYLVFESVYRTKMLLNFGIVAEETILDAFEVDDDDDLNDLFFDWKGLIDDIKVMSYTLNLNSSGGTIKILSRGFKVYDVY